MRTVKHPQQQLGAVDVANIQLDPKSRDDIPQILRGLQYIYLTPEIRERVFAILADVIPTRTGKDGTVGKADPQAGRPGMDQWKILVLGTLRLGLNADFDRILELANEHNTLRRMLGHGDWADESQYSLQTIRENLRLFTQEILDRINQEVVRAGHRLVKKSPDEGLAIRCDSFVVETDVHHPTDITLLLDAVRKAIETAAQLCRDEGLSDWRQSAYNIRQLKKAYRRVQQLKRSKSKDEAKREARQAEIEQAYRDYLALAGEFLARVRDTRAMLHIGCSLPAAMLAELDEYIADIERQIDQTVTTLPGFGGGQTLLFPIFYQADSDFVDARIVWAAATRLKIGGQARWYDNSGSFAVETRDLHAFLEFGFGRGFVVHLGYRDVDYNEAEQDWDDYRAKIAEMSIGYRW